VRRTRRRIGRAAPAARRQTAHLPADEISARIAAEMNNWIRDAEQYDDLTFIVMKVRSHANE
jgi:serine phosphatase RsbU (regulator of sigma subunit)